MCERYDRSTCTQELLLRSTILKNINDGWKPVGPFSIPVVPTVELKAPTKRGLDKPGDLGETQISDGGDALLSVHAPLEKESPPPVPGED